jgi:RNA polymerase sigma-70 factor, ECF subfamily
MPRGSVEKSEDRVIRELRSGSVAAFDAVYARYRVPLFTFLRRLCRQPQLAEDLFQSTWLKLARSAARLRPDTDLKAWLFSVARNEYRSHRRWQRVDLRRLLAARAELTTVGAAPLDAICDAERALSRVSAADRELLLLVSVAGFDSREVAAMLGISYEATRQRLARARAQLARSIEGLE